MDHERIRTLIVEDEPLARETVRELLGRHRAFGIVGECDDAGSALKMIESTGPDLLFLDIRLPGMDAFEMLAKLDPSTMPVVVFVTAYDQYAIRAFEVHALDYLLKPFSDERFEKVVAHILSHFSGRRVHTLTRRLLAAVQKADGSEAGPYIWRVVIRETNRTLMVPVQDVDWIEAYDYYARLHLGSKSHLLRESLTKLVAKLDPHSFVRIHRSAIVNLDRVCEVKRAQVILRDGTTLKASRLGRTQLRAAFHAGDGDGGLRGKGEGV